MSDDVEACHSMVDNALAEMHNRYMELRAMNLGLQCSLKSIQNRIRILFAKKKEDGNLANFDLEYRWIMRDYYRTIEFADEKDKLARYVAKLMAVEIKKIEIRKRFCKLATQSTSHSSQRISLSQRKNKKFQPRGEKRKRVRTAIHLSKGRRRHTISAGSFVKSRRRTPHTSTSNREAINNTISAADSQDTLSTEQMQQDQQTANVKVSSEAESIVIPITQEFETEWKLEGATETVSRSDGQDHSNLKKQKKSRSFTAVKPDVSEPVVQNPAPLFETPPPTQEETDEKSDEPTYCVCNDIFYGKMIACDGKNCSIEWFHYPCVGITAAPRGKWYCSQCITAKQYILN